MTRGLSVDNTVDSSGNVFALLSITPRPACRHRGEMLRWAIGRAFAFDRSGTGATMSLTAVKVTADEFGEIFAHLTSHNPKYRCMHMREPRTVDGERALRYLHIMCAISEQPQIIEGLISGPGVFWHYKLLRTRTGTQLNVLAERGEERARKRIAKRFVAEILRRIGTEKEKPTFRPDYKKGEYYVQRRLPGSLTSDRDCKRAVEDEVVDPLFVSRLSLWGLKLWRE